MVHATLPKYREIIYLTNFGKYPVNSKLEGRRPRERSRRRSGLTREIEMPDQAIDRSN